MSLYIAEGESGKYDDWNCWVVGVFSTRDKAKAACKASESEKTKQLTWSYNAKSGNSNSSQVKFSDWDSGYFRVRRVELDEIIA